MTAEMKQKNINNQHEDIEPLSSLLKIDFQKYQDCFKKTNNVSKQNTYNQSEYNLIRYYEFRLAAYYLSQELFDLPIIEKIIIIGSVARPLIKEPPHFKKRGPEEWHYCKDLDLVLWLNEPFEKDLLREIQQKRVLGLKKLEKDLNITFAHHQIELFCFDKTDSYMGRICQFKVCPKQGKEECWIPGCGHIPFIKIMQDFKLNPSALNSENSIFLFSKNS